MIKKLILAILLPFVFVSPVILADSRFADADLVAAFELAPGTVVQEKICWIDSAGRVVCVSW